MTRVGAFGSLDPNRQDTALAAALAPTSIFGVCALTLQERAVA